MAIGAVMLRIEARVPRNNVLRWRDGAGWIVLSGGGEVDSASTGDIEAEALARVHAGDPIAYIWAGSDIERADEHLVALDELGGPTGYLVDALTEDDDTLRNQLKIAGMIVLGDASDPATLYSALIGAALEGISEAHSEGAVVLGSGYGGTVLGSVVGTGKGLNWVEQAIIVPYYDRPNSAQQLRSLLTQHPTHFGLGLAAGSALALGPNGEVETWGNQQITVILGNAYRI